MTRPSPTTATETVTRFHGLIGETLLIDGIAYTPQERCVVHWPGNCSQVAYAITDEGYVVCRLHAKQEERDGRKVVRIKGKEKP